VANILTNTEDLSHSDWVKEDSPTITTDQYAAPTFAGINAGRGDKLEDASGSAVCAVSQNENITSDTSTWVFSVFVRKDATTSRFPAFVLRMQEGSTIEVGCQINTQTGEIANFINAPDDKAVVDVDANWWRVWLKKANNGTGNTFLVARVFPAAATTLGGGFDSSLTGFIGMWGANVTNTSTLQAYEPDPFYVFAGRILIAPVGFA
jgi:hypothetical protein